jgi:hypothetical protein
MNISPVSPATAAQPPQRVESGNNAAAVSANRPQQRPEQPPAEPPSRTETPQVDTFERGEGARASEAARAEQANRSRRDEISQVEAQNANQRNAEPPRARNEQPAGRTIDLMG